VSDTARDLGLARRDRLRSRRDFVRLARDGERRASPYFVMFLARSGRRGRDLAGDRPRLGVTASRKVGNSVVRNGVKRRIRTAFRIHRDLLPRGSDVVVIARPGSAALGGERVAGELAALFAGRPR
jgi:ribonuclease P protein component